MNRNDIIASLKAKNETDENYLRDLLHACNVRVCRANGTTEPNHEIRGPYSAMRAMENDETITRIEYRHNQQWLLVC